MKFVLVVLICLLGSLCFAENRPSRVRIITVETLAKNRADWVVVDAREKSEFENGHIPESRSMEWGEWTVRSPGLWSYLFGSSANWGKVIDKENEIEQRLQAEGLTHARPIVVVGKPATWGEEGRIAWNLLYWGAEDVALLDGGYPAWIAAGKPVEVGAPKSAAQGTFRVALRSERRAQKEEVMKSLFEKNRTLLDARDQEEFNGKTVTAQKRGGHLPGAILIPVKDLYEKDGKYLSAEGLKKLLPGNPQRPIAYCVGGVRSALLALLIEARLGFVVANYDGSLWEWASDASLPLVK